MGVPAFYRWLSEKYPKIVQDVLEERVHLQPGTSITLPFDATRPNPQGIEFDNLYIDMNGIIHPCSHPENGPQPETEQDMYENVCRYVDRLFHIMRPRKLLYLAIDGVAPRAKMNQQRARRFRSAEEARELKELEQHVRNEMSGILPKPKDAWDSNVITPGTPFMMDLAEYIRFYIRKRISTNPAWRNVRVIFSDASIPGEGEHKIMSHIRLQRSQPGYDPNSVHVLHGLDADLIMLALATHEAHFYISREEVLFGRKSEEAQYQRRMESGFMDKQRSLDEAAGADAMQLEENMHKSLQRISIPILREYLMAEFEICITPARIPFPPSFERLIDDIVFLCFFVGNDFLPHLPSLDIRDGALDYLFNVYKRVLPSLGDYITKSGGNVNLNHVGVILAEVGSIEDYVFAMKYESEKQNDMKRKEMLARKKQGKKEDEPPLAGAIKLDPRRAKGRSAKILEKNEHADVALSRGHQSQKDARLAKKAKHMMEDDNSKAAQALKNALFGDIVKEQTYSVDGEKEAVNDDDDVKEGSGDVVAMKEDELVQDDKIKKRSRDTISNDDVTSEHLVKAELGVVGDIDEEFDDDDVDDVDDDEIEACLPKVDDIIVQVDPAAAAAFKERVKAQQQQKLDDYAQNVVDNVRLHEAGWKDRYYADKCKADDVTNHGGREHLFRSYIVGLCWVMKYYYDGVASWKWYFPFHYAPFASDLTSIERFQKDCKTFELSTPFNPVEQLMAVLPSDSEHAVPKAARWLMKDEESPIIDFYPEHVPVDPNGKAMPWLWVVLLPFIEEDRLLSALSPTMAKWTKEELLCNARGLDDGYLYIHRQLPLAKKLITVVDGKTAKSPKTRLTDSAAYGCSGFTGSVRPPLSHEIHSLGEDEEVQIDPPSTSKRITNRSFDSIFAEKIDSNEAVCVAFTEPAKLSHKSVMLPGAKPLPPKLTADDKKIRRPRLNRYGGSIASMGMSNGQSFKSGYGSMNISNYERQLAEQTGRGNQMNQAGTRTWGSFEPQQKHQRGDAHQPQHNIANPFMGQKSDNSQPQRQYIANPFMRPPAPSSGQQGWNGAPQWQNQHQARVGPPPQHFPQQHYPPHQEQQHYGHQQQQQQQQQQWQQRPPQQQQWNRPPPPSNQNYGRGGGGGGGGSQQGGFNFRSYNQPTLPPGHGAGGRGGGAQNNATRPRADAAVMNNLKAQLKNTLNNNRRPG
jgi:5'-3' exoribonuclease 2